MNIEEGSERCSAVGFEGGGRGPGARKCAQTLEAGKAKEKDSPLELLPRNTAQLTPGL